MKIFGDTGDLADFGVIGSDNDSSPVKSRDLLTIQSNTNYLLGLKKLTNNAAEPIRFEDFNSITYLITSQLAYLFQNGMPEYDATTNYYNLISFCTYGGVIYQSINGTSVSPNIGNQPDTSPTKWKSLFYNVTFTGTTSGITKSMVDLGNVDNTSDVNKPVSTATQTAIQTATDLTVHLAGTETITGLKNFTTIPNINNIPVLPNLATGTSSIMLGGTASTSDYSTGLRKNTVASGYRSTAIGSYCTATGSESHAFGYASNAAYSNSVAIGHSSTAGGADQLKLGNASSVVHAQSALVVDSDIRLKDKIIETPLGLKFVNKIIASQYVMKNSTQEIIKEPEIKDKNGKVIKKIVIEKVEHKHSRPHQGFIADQVKEVIDELGIDFAGYKDSKIDGGEDKKGLAYTEFIPPLYKAVQELHKIVLDQQKIIDKLLNKE